MKVCPQCHQKYPEETSFCFIDGVGLVPLDDPRFGTTVAGRYVIEDLLGAGGMATVYRARDRFGARSYALKVLNEEFAQDARIRERLVREGKHAQRIAHPNIIEVYESTQTDDGAPCLVMELLSGQSLAEAITHQALPMTRALPILIQVSRALGRAHDFGVLHRDLKPENVFLSKGDHVRLLDFGIAFSAADARLTNMGEVFGTPQYMAPERLRGHGSDDPSSDLYALGVLVFETLSRQLPFDAPTPAGWLLVHERGPAPRLDEVLPSAPKDLADLVARLLAKDPAERPSDAHQVRAALVAIASSLKIAVPPEPTAAVAPAAPAPSAGEVWGRRLALFDRMLVTGFGRPDPSGASRVPPDLQRTLDALRAKVTQASELRAQLSETHKSIEAADDEGRRARQQLGVAMDELSLDSSRLRDEARAARAVVAQRSAARAAFVPKVKEAHRELVTWEGRSGFLEPSQQLVDAYEALTDLTGQWLRARKLEQKAEAEAVEKEASVADVDSQIKQLRQSLKDSEASLVERTRESRARVAELGRHTDALEEELLYLASRFCAPLRAKPELGPMFYELEKIV
jgi:serine/threonine protein kinase